MPCQTGFFWLVYKKYKKKRREILKRNTDFMIGYYGDKEEYRKHFLNDKFVGRFVQTPTPCSCSKCGNPRKHFGEKTLQEIKADLEDYWLRHGFDFFFEEDDFEEEYYIRWLIEDDIWNKFVCN